MFGYIRIYNLQLIIPKEICYLCLLFYYLVDEQFVLADDELEIVSSDENHGKVKNIAKMKRVDDDDPWIFKWMMIHGNLIIDPQINPYIVVEWTFKINVSFCCIGINSSYIMGDNKVAYQLHADCVKGDVIKMVLTVSKKELTYYKNGKLSEYRIDDIDPSEKYHLNLKMHSSTAIPGDGIELTDLNVKGQTCLSFRTDSELN